MTPKVSIAIQGPPSFKTLLGSLFFCSRFEPRRVKKVNHQPSISGLGCVTHLDKMSCLGYFRTLGAIHLTQVTLHKSETICGWLIQDISMTYGAVSNLLSCQLQRLFGHLPSAKVPIYI